MPEMGLPGCCWLLPHHPLRSPPVLQQQAHRHLALLVPLPLPLHHHTSAQARSIVSSLMVRDHTKIPCGLEWNRALVAELAIGCVASKAGTRAVHVPMSCQRE